MRIVFGFVLALAALPHRARAGDMPDPFAGIAEALSTTTEPVHLPVVIAGGGATLHGAVGSLALGYAWGERERGFLAASTVSRVVVGLRAGDDHDALSLTYGWYVSSVLSAGLDVGVEATRAGVGPTTRFTFGTGGLALQLTGGATFEPSAHAVGSAQLVVELDDLVGWL